MAFVFTTIWFALKKKKAPLFESEGKQCDFHHPPPVQAESGGPQPPFISSGHSCVDGLLIFPGEAVGDL